MTYHLSTIHVLQTKKTDSTVGKKALYAISFDKAAKIMTHLVVNMQSTFYNKTTVTVN